MGSMDKSQEELTILVTGFGPFKDQYPRNPSWDIASSLPEYLPPLNAKSSTSVRSSSLALPPVRIIVHPEPVRVTYSAVRELIPKLWTAGYGGVSKIDYVLHIGMASTKKQYVLEELGHRDDYRLKDLDEKLPDQDPAADDYPWRGVPSQLTTELDVADIKKRWESYLPSDLVLKTSRDAGHFLCDYIYFNSLASCYKTQQRRRVAFMHVPAVKPLPADAYQESIDLGREIAIQLLRSIVESELAGPQRVTSSFEPQL
ncbi:Pyroglutamyl-peptidase 1 [Cytospora mali]|uniref:Pyroglutamyl-peptidase 1 n=1 Tax=Cytospora mali TaxID=578113 RepID=A0A194VW17_CYTMA|nr:Pyroglutamyl-peptidase 1 [Valsa mali]